MDNFDLRTFLAEGKLYEAMFDAATTERIAQQVADAFTAEDNELDLKYVVSPGVEAGHFDLDVEAGPNTPGEDWKDENGFGISNYLGQYAGGSFLIRDGIVINAAMRSAPVARVSPEGEVEMISAEESRAAIGMEESETDDFLELIGQGVDSFPRPSLGEEEIEEEYGVEGPEAADIDAIADEPISEYTNKMEKSELEEGIIDTIKDKIVSVGKKLLGKFSPEEQASMKAAAEKVLGPNYSKEDITLDKAKEIGKIIAGGLDESQELNENLRKKIGNALAGLGMSTAFVAGHGFGGTDAGAITAGIGVAAAVVGMLMANIEEAQEAPKSSKMKKSELKEMIKAAMLAEVEISEDMDMIPAEKLFALIARDLEFSPLVQDGVMLSKEDAIEIMKHVIAIEGSDISAEAALGEYIASGDLNEAKEEDVEDVEDVEIDTEEEVDVDMDMDSDVEGIDVKQDADAELSGTVGDVQDNLEAALEAARKLGDEKLEDQIGNTLTFFTRSHVVKEGDVVKDEAELGL